MSHFSRNNSFRQSHISSRRVYMSTSQEPQTTSTNSKVLVIKKQYEDSLYRKKEAHKKQIRDLEKAHFEGIEEKDRTIRALKQLLRELERNLDRQRECHRDHNFNGHWQDTYYSDSGGQSGSVHKLLDQIHRLQEEREKDLMRLTELEMRTSGASLNTSFDSIASENMVDSFSDVESTFSCNNSLNMSMESISSVGKLSGTGTPTIGLCTTDTEKELEITKRRELSLEGEITKQKDDNHRLRQTVAKLQEMLDNKTPESGSIPEYLTGEPGEAIHGAFRSSSYTQVGSSRASSMVKDRQISTLEKQIEFLKDQVATKTEQAIHSEMQLRKKQERSEEDKQRELKAVADAVSEERTRHQVEINKLNKILGAMSALAMKLNYDFQEVKSAYALLKDQVRDMPLTVAREVADTQKQIEKSLQCLGQENSSVVHKYLREMKLRKKYHNDLVELRGNIRVFCRIRPRIKEDEDDKHELVVTSDPDDDGVVKVDNGKIRATKYDLDKAFGLESTQSQIFDEVSCLVRSVIDGYNVCIFAYGQTGSGKTYTMEGPSGDPGINQRALRLLFEETRDINWNYDISAGVVEIYNETIRDLLNPDPNNKLEVKMKTEGGFHVPGLVTMAVTSLQDVNNVFETGRRNRAVASTNLNEHSSRSHCLLCVTVKGNNTTTGLSTFGRLNLVDLAGSERLSKSQACGARLKEAQNINRSLACLGDVIHALRNKHSHVPYRNSKLTYLLQDSLGGDSKTLMIVQVSPVFKNVSETLCSLSFGHRVRCVELGQASRNVETRSTEPGNSKPQKQPTTQKQRSRPATIHSSSEATTPRSPPSSPLTSPVSSSPCLSPNSITEVSPSSLSATHQKQHKRVLSSSSLKSSSRSPCSTPTLPVKPRAKSTSFSIPKKDTQPSSTSPTKIETKISKSSPKCSSTISEVSPEVSRAVPKTTSFFSFRRTRPSK